MLTAVSHMAVGASGITVGMTKKANPSSDVSQLTGLLAIDAYAADPAAREQATGPDWIKLTPRGKFEARDGRKFDADPEALAARYAVEAIAIPVDVDHATVKKAMFGDAAPAIGWIEKLEARPDGLYGQVKWLEEGVRVLAARSHRYISPVLKSDPKTGKTIWLHSAALVAAPGISMPAVASADPTHETETPMLKAIALALGLTEDAGDQSCLSAIANLKARIDPATHQQTLADLTASKAELETLNASIRKGKVDALMEAALVAKKISPAQRAGYEALCATDDGLTQVTALLGTLGTGLAASGLDEQRPPSGLNSLSAEDKEVMAQLGLTEDEFRKANGLTAV